MQRVRLASISLCCALAGGVIHPPLTAATYSIAAADMASGQVGGAVTSCVGALDLAMVYGSAPGFGVIHAQAQLDTRLRGRDHAVELLMQGVAPSDIITEITASAFDAQFESRQYGVVDLMGRSAGFTGMQAQMYKHDQQARVGTFTYSVQGNILTSQQVLDQASAAFEGGGCDLADRLMLALEAGAANGQGDSRCTPDGIPSDAAFIEVDRSAEPAGSYLMLSVSDTGPDSPLPMLRARFDAWRVMHPCVMGVAGAAAVSGRGGMAGRADGGAGAAGGGAGAGPAAGMSAGADAGPRGGAAAAAPSGGAGATSDAGRADVAGSHGVAAISGSGGHGASLTTPATHSGCSVTLGPAHGAQTWIWTWMAAGLAVRRRRAGARAS